MADLCALMVPSNERERNREAGAMQEALRVLLVGGPIAIGALWLFSQLDSWDRERTQKRLSPAEYEACIAKENAEFVRNCHAESLATDLEKTRDELPVLMSPGERINHCRTNLAIANAQAKYFPDVPSACGKKP